LCWEEKGEYCRKGGGKCGSVVGYAEKNARFVNIINAENLSLRMLGMDLCYKQLLHG
jgi:hypothetical protein